MAFTAKISDLIAEDKTGLLTKHDSWERVSLLEVATILNGAPFDASLFNTTAGMPLARIRDVVAGKTATYYTGSYDDAYLLREGDLLVGMDGDFNTGYWGEQQALLNQRVCKIEPNDALYDKALMGFVLPGYLAAINASTPSITVKHLSSKTITDIDLPWPPRAEQTRIVEKLEELLSDLDAGVAELKAAQRKLAQYRQSLLKAAVEGALTADWRATRSEPQESGAELLQRILNERRARWEQKQLAKFAEQGKTPPAGWRAKYSEPVAPDTTGLPELPDGWVWSTLDQLTVFITSGSRGWANYYANHGATFIRSQNINKDWLDLADIAYVNPPKNSEGARTRVQLGDLLLTITGANVGKTAWVDVELEEAYVSQHVALMRPVDTKLSDYLHLYLTAVAGGRGQLNEEAYGAGKPGLNLQQVAAVCIPLPGDLELVNLLEEVAEQLDEATAQHEAIERALKQAAAQRKNILKAAFAGQLVPQDPNDEPASVLLARIRAAKADNTAVGRQRGKKKS